MTENNDGSTKENTEEAGLQVNEGDNNKNNRSIPPNDPPDPTQVNLTQISPIAASTIGGISVTLNGSGFQPGVEVYFGTDPAPQMTYISSHRITVILPAASQTGIVDVTVINPDGGSAVRSNGFTYVTTDTTQNAEIFGITPLGVIEDTSTEVTIRGRNLITAYNDGVLAFRGPSDPNHRRSDRARRNI